MDYKKYELCLKEVLFVFGKGIVVSGSIAFLFYRSVFGFILFPIIFYILKKREEQIRGMLRKKELHMQFMEALKSIHGALMAGLSMEYAWKEAEEEIRLLHGEYAVLYLELAEINRQVALNVPIETLVYSFAVRTEIDDIMQFAEVFQYGKRSGGKWKEIIEATIYRINHKYETEKQIEVLLAGKKLEQQILSIIPLGILAFLQFASWDYMQVLYHNVLGIICMTICLVGYIIAMVIAERILQIQV
ncbi:MAG: hypothetical protein IKJ01_07850 [Lachnospiraceae bacterium]|nr:hypothetical protein [Lachnospiraceae bacterium]